MKCINKWKLSVLKKEDKGNFFKNLKKKPGKKMILGGSILGVLLLAGIIFFSPFLSKKKF